ncbi:hypothetical protein DFJ63DRAFT_311869 [Scheffersomyces coipomensis]|uniref:uncharacterized protein n=1 Tax=Scheffersomyces coipomensis TaxID=1788519 RepID=UPI00315D1EEB
MDFEEQLEKLDKLESPALVGSSIRSADDSPHHNYIHPERSTTHPNATSSSTKKSLLNQNITASLDDLINEGALLGSEADFDKFLDQDGTVKGDAKYEPVEETVAEEANENEDEEEENPVTAEKEVEAEKSTTITEPVSNQIIEEDVDSEVEENEGPIGEKPSAKHIAADDDDKLTSTSSFYQQQGDYSTPNLSEYQLDNEIKDHSTLLDSVKSYDPQRLPKVVIGSGKESFKRPESPRKAAASPIRASLIDHSNHNESFAREGGIHTPFFHTDARSDRSRSRSRSAVPERSISRNSNRPHLARGDSYKSTHLEEPSKYELPPDFATSEDVPQEQEEQAEEEQEEQEEDDRRGRASKPTMGEAVAKAEAKAENLPQLPSDPSLVTTGDYTNFNVDTPESELPSAASLLASRSISSTNYLRSISRSRTRPAPIGENEKNDSNPDALAREGALVNDDPYSTIDDLDSIVENVLHPKKPVTPTETKEPVVSEAPKEKEVEEPIEESKGEEPVDESKEVEPVEESKEIEPVEESIEAEPKEEEPVEETKVEETKEDEPVEESKEVEPVEKEVTTSTKDLSIDEPKEETVASAVKEPATTTATDDLDDLDISPEEIRKHLESQPIYLFTSLAGGMQIMPRTNRLATILQANGIKFEYRDLGTDEEAKKIWKRQANGKTLPGVVRGDDFIGNWDEINDANEEYKLRELLYETL